VTASSGPTARKWFDAGNPAWLSDSPQRAMCTIRPPEK
jgi:hypothetical protein